MTSLEAQLDHVKDKFFALARYGCATCHGVGITNQHTRCHCTARKTIAEYRAALKLTQTEFGAELGVTRRTVTRWEAMQTPPKRIINMIERLVETYDPTKPTK